MAVALSDATESERRRRTNGAPRGRMGRTSLCPPVAPLATVIPAPRRTPSPVLVLPVASRLLGGVLGQPTAEGGWSHETHSSTARSSSLNAGGVLLSQRGRRASLSAGGVLLSSREACFSLNAGGVLLSAQEACFSQRGRRASLNAGVMLLSKRESCFSQRSSIRSLVHTTAVR